MLFSLPYTIMTSFRLLPKSIIIYCGRKTTSHRFCIKGAAHEQVSVNKGGVDSEANVTEIHEALHLDEMAEGTAQRSGHFGIFSVCWGSSGREIAAGTGESSVLLYDIEAAKVGGCSPSETKPGSFHVMTLAAI